MLDFSSVISEYRNKEERDDKRSVSCTCSIDELHVKWKQTVLSPRETYEKWLTPRSRDSNFSGTEVTIETVC